MIYIQIYQEYFLNISASLLYTRLDLLVNGLIYLSKFYRAPAVLGLYLPRFNRRKIWPIPDAEITLQIFVLVL